MTLTAERKSSEYKVISNCPKCKGALLLDGEVWKCFTCSRVFKKNGAGFVETFEMTMIKKWRR